MRRLFQKFPHYKGLDLMDCGPTCLRIIAKYYGRTFSAAYLRKLTYKTKTGVSLLHLSDAAEQIGLRTLGARCSYEALLQEQPGPFIAHWQQRHYVVVYRVTKRKVYVSDPAVGLLTYTVEEFKKGWCSTVTNGTPEGIVLFFEPTPKFTTVEGQEEEAKVDMSFYLAYLNPHRRLIVQLLIGLTLAALFSLAMPLLTQALVDQGVQQSDIDFVVIVIIAQVMIFLGSTVVGLIRAWVLLHMSTRINITIVSDFLAKLMRLPISFFDRKNLGDILQRMQDHKRIETFLTSQSLNTIFSIFTLLVYSVVLWFYSSYLFVTFLVATVLYGVWVSLFLKKRRAIDYKNFDELAANQNTTVGLIQGMQEIKLQAGEKERRWKWEHIQIRLFRISMESLKLEQWQGAGGAFINQGKNILISYWAAKEVIDGNMTLGMMMAVTQILGYLDGPILQFVEFLRQAQDAKISLERLGEIHNKQEETEENAASVYTLPAQGDLRLEGVSFRYGDPLAPWVLEDISVTIPSGKTTAIVGESGSGKTTLLKLLLRFYEPEEGQLFLGDFPLSDIDMHTWRSSCGVVMQDGYLFSDTIANNIVVNEEQGIDKVQMVKAAEIANAREFIERLPLHYNTKVGMEGQNLSMGQRQRLLIARAVYKQPDYLFFDEASSALDARNEKEITENLSAYNKDRTVVVIAHRLSTVRNADQILVLAKGKIAERGTHEELTAARGLYYTLVKNQLELGR